MSRMALKVLVLVCLMAVMSLAIVSTVSAAVCPGGPGPTCIELRGGKPTEPQQYPYLHGWSNRADLANTGRARLPP